MKLSVPLLFLIACHKHDGDNEVAVALPPAPFDELEVKLPPGTSDLSLDNHGHLWSIAERAAEPGHPAGANR